MTKEQCAEELCQLGYDASVDDFTVMIRVEKMPSKKEQKQFAKVIHSLGYQASYGWRLKQEKSRKGNEDATRKHE